MNQSSNMAENRLEKVDLKHLLHFQKKHSNAKLSSPFEGFSGS